MGTGEFNAGDNPAMDYNIHPVGSGRFPCPCGRALDFESASPRFKSSFLPLDEFAFGGPKFNSFTLCK